ALVDIGGTLWPNSWPVRATDSEGRLARLRVVLPDLSLERATLLVNDIISKSRDLNGGTVMVPELIRVEADDLVTMCLNDHGMRAILVHPDDPPPTSSKADLVAPDLWECAKALKAMLRGSA